MDTKIRGARVGNSASSSSSKFVPHEKQSKSEVREEYRNKRPRQEETDSSKSKKSARHHAEQRASEKNRRRGREEIEEGVRLIKDTFDALKKAPPKRLEEEFTEEFRLNLARILESCYHVSFEYFSLCEENEFGLGKGKLPWDTDAFRDLWKQCRWEVWDFIFHNFRTLLQPIKMYVRETVVNDGRKAIVKKEVTAVLWELAYRIHMNCVFNICGTPPLWKPSLSSRRPSESAYVLEHDLVVCDSSYSEMRLSDLLDSICELDDRCLSIPYDPALVMHTELLEARLYELFSFSHGSSVLDIPDLVECINVSPAGDVPTPSKGQGKRGSSRDHEDDDPKGKKEDKEDEEEEGGETDEDPKVYVLKEEAFKNASLPLMLMRMAFSRYASIPDASPQDYEALKKGFPLFQRQKVRDALSHGMSDLATKFSTDGPDVEMEPLFLMISTRPSEVVRYVGNSKSKARLREGSTSRLDPDHIMSSSRERAIYNPIIDASKRRLVDAVKKSVTDIPIEKDLAMCCVLNKVFKARSGLAPLGKYILLRTYVHNSITPGMNNIGKVATSKVPHIAQMFNSFNLCYQGKKYTFETFEELLAVWFYIVAAKLSAVIDNRSVEKCYEDFFGLEWRDFFMMTPPKRTDGHLKRATTFVDQLQLVGLKRKNKNEVLRL